MNALTPAQKTKRERTKREATAGDEREEVGKND